MIVSDRMLKSQMLRSERGLWKVQQTEHHRSLLTDLRLRCYPTVVKSRSRSNKASMSC
jgi:hypothetical protein